MASRKGIRLRVPPLPDKVWLQFYDVGTFADLFRTKEEADKDALRWPDLALLVRGPYVLADGGAEPK